jgi:diguanylate cyclase (GGDEF)-like protein
VAVTALALVCLGAARIALGSAGGTPARLGLALDALVALVALRGAWLSSRLARDARSRRAWLFQTLMPATWLVAPIAWLAGLPEPVADAARAAAIGAIAVSWWFASRVGEALPRARVSVDGAIGASAAFVAGWALAFDEAWHRAGGGAAGAVAVGLPLAAVWIAVFGSAMAWTELRDRHRVMPVLYVVVLVLVAGSDISWSLGGAPWWAVAWAVHRLATRSYGGTSPRARLLTTHRGLVYAPYALVAPAAIALTVRGLDGDVSPAEIVGAIVIASLLVVRQHVTLLENRNLVLRLEATEQLLRHQATHDSLTGLPGRVVLWEQLEDVAERRRTGHVPVAIAFLDLDGFKAINDQHGHAAGDAVLVEVARRMRQVLAPHGDDAVAVRMSGDEFAVLLMGDAAQNPPGTARRLLDALDAPVLVNDVPLTVSGSVGVAAADHGELNPSALLRAADVAMYDVKHSGKRGVQVARSDRSGSRI